MRTTITEGPARNPESQTGERRALDAEAVVRERRPLQGRTHEGSGPSRALPPGGPYRLDPDPRHEWLPRGPERAFPGSQTQGPRLWPVLDHTHHDLPHCREARLLENQSVYGESTHLKFNRAEQIEKR